MRAGAGYVLVSIASLLAGCDGGAGPSAGVERIVLVSIDTLRADRVGCYGAAGAETPALDALAAEGARLETAISPAPLTLPSHVTLLTGLEPPQHGVRHNGLFRLSDDVVPLAEHLRGSGFATAGFVSAFVLDGRYGLSRGFDHYDDRLGMLSSEATGAAAAERRGDQTVDAAIAWLGQAPERFFLWVHLYDPHAPYAPPEPFAARFSGHLYDGEIAFADAQFGRLRAAVADRWPAGTLWWLTSDHGDSRGEHGEPTHSYLVYDATQRIPMLVAGPGVPAGGVVSGVAALADVAPTVLALADLPPLPGASGTSLAAALRGGGASPRRAAWVETLATQLDLGWSPLLGVRTASHKYVRAPEPELYALGDDPRELTNRAGEQPELAAELDRLVEEVVATGRPVVPSFQPDAEERAQLEALGYLRGAAPVRADAALGRVGGPDPKREIGLIAQIEALMRLLSERRGPEALAAYDRIAAPGYALLLLGASAALAADDVERAEREARAALELSEQAEPLVLIAKAQVQRGRFAEAKRSLERAVAVDPEKAEPWLGLGFLAEREGRVDEAIQLYERARALPLVYPEAIWRAAALQLEAGRRDEARVLLAELPPAEQRMPESAERLARAERAAGRVDLALTRVDGALRDFSHVPALWLLKGDLLDQQGQLRPALAARRRALELSPGRPDAANAVAWTLGRLGVELAEAERLASGAIERVGRKPALLDTLATVRTAQGRFAEALALADEGLARADDGDRIDLSFRRAEALAGLGRRAEAEAALGEAKRSAEAKPTAFSTWSESERRVRRLLDGTA